MITVGEPLGKRYVVSKAPEDSRAGALFEVIDRGAAAVIAQLLADGPVAPEMVGAVGPELLKVPPNGALVRPRELTLTRARVPVAIIDKPGLVPVRDRVAELVTALGAAPAAATLFRWFAAMALDLGRVHEAGVTHGAISLRLVIANAYGPLSGCQLSGFGVGGILRRLDPSLTHTPRQDLVALLNALQEVFATAGVQPEGSAAAKWMLLRHSAQHGEHPALASGESLSKTLEEFAGLATEEPERASRPSTVPPPRDPRRATMAPPPRAGGAAQRPERSGSMRPPSGGERATTTGRTTERRPTQQGGKAAPPPPPKPSRAPLIVGALVVIGAGAAAVAFAYRQRKRPQDPAPMGSVRLRAPGGAPLRCPREAGEAIQTVAGGGAVGEFDAVCGRDDKIVVAWRAGTGLAAASRASTRGAALERYTPTAVQGAVELGPLLVQPDGVWAAWRNGVGAPLGFARVDTRSAIPRPVALAGWDDVPLQGVWPLKVTPSVAWAVMNVVSEGGSHAVLVEAAMGAGGNRPPAITWYLGPGAVRATIPGDTSTLLFHQRVAPAVGSGPARHALNVLRVNLGSVGALRPPPQATSVRGANLPDAITRRSPTMYLDGEELSAVPRGVAAPDNYQSFAVTIGQRTLPDACPAPGRCVSPGVVWVVAFPDQGDGVPVPAARNALAEDLMRGDDGTVRVLTYSPAPSATATATRRLVTVPNPLAPPTGEGAAVRGTGLPRARLLSCGPEPWVFVDDGAESPHIAAAPLECLSAR
ncbi:MAG: hypothetical protein R3A52_16330 [Polyangiales bacterium]